MTSESAQDALKHQKRAPRSAQGASNDRKMNKKSPQRAPDCQKERQKSSLFGAWPGGLREALTIILETESKDFARGTQSKAQCAEVCEQEQMCKVMS